MDKFIKLSNEDKKFIYEHAANKYKMHHSIIEKDFWICFILDYLFDRSKYKRLFTFKGGTSLSKVYGVINRMSEDIDLILDWSYLGVPKDEPITDRSKRQQELYNDNLNDLAKAFISGDLYNDLNDFFSEYGCKVEAIREEQIINIYYPKVFNDDNVGILPCVRLEIGPLAAWSPANESIVTPYINNVINNFTVSSAKVRTVTISRTFWEKITILHREANRPENKKMPSRYFRHYYDVYKIANSEYIDEILKENYLLEKVVLFKTKFYNDNWAKYNEAKIGTLKLFPPIYRMEELKSDYNKMKEMFFDDTNSFEIIMDFIKNLEVTINTN